MNHLIINYSLLIINYLVAVARTLNSIIFSWQFGVLVFHISMILWWVGILPLILPDVHRIDYRVGIVVVWDVIRVLFLALFLLVVNHFE